jgi:hypothetical protein
MAPLLGARGRMRRAARVAPRVCAESPDGARRRPVAAAAQAARPPRFENTRIDVSQGNAMSLRP